MVLMFPQNSTSPSKGVEKLRSTPMRHANVNRGDAPGPDIPLCVENHAAKAVKRFVVRRREMSARGKRPSVANCATARELACWVWAIGRMAEGADA